MSVTVNMTTVTSVEWTPGVTAHLRYCFKALVTVFTSQSAEFSKSSSLHIFTSGEQQGEKKS